MRAMLRLLFGWWVRWCACVGDDMQWVGLGRGRGPMAGLLVVKWVCARVFFLQLLLVLYCVSSMHVGTKGLLYLLLASLGLLRKDMVIFETLSATMILTMIL